MKRRLVGWHIEFKYNVRDGVRWWYVDGQWCREDDGPAWESMRTGYCQWWERGKYVRSSQ